MEVTEPLTREKIERMARIALVLIDAALANRCVQEYIADPRPPRLWTEESVHSNPPVRASWQYCTVFAGIGDALAAARNKRWGEFIGILPLEPDDPVGWSRVLYLYSEDFPYNRRVNQRKALKRLLGRGHRRLVGRAMGETKGRFLAKLSEEEAHVLRRRLKLEPGDFWRAVKGKVFLDLPKKAQQRDLFSLPMVKE